MLKLKGSFLLIGAGPDMPQVHILSAAAHAALDAGLSLVSRYEAGDIRRGEVLKSIFGVDCLAAVPAWSYDAMAEIATDYKGPNEQKTRYIAACIATGRPIGDESGKGGGGGGNAPLEPPKPIKPRPGGAAVAGPVESRADRDARRLAAIRSAR